MTQIISTGPPLNFPSKSTIRDTALQARLDINENDLSIFRVSYNVTFAIASSKTNR